MMEVNPAPRRPSLYTAIRLARIVQNVRERLKARVLTRARKNALEVLEDSSVETVWREKMIVRTHHVPAAIHKSRRPPRIVSGRNANFSGLLQDLDHQVSPNGGSLSVVAAQEHLFLKQDPVDFGQKQIRDISHVFDISTLLVERVQLAQSERLWESPEFKRLDAEECSKYLANLEHLLLCLQQAALEALVKHSLHKLQSDYQHWDQYLEQQKKVHGGCFSEWVGGKPPLNSTMPWNIKPSLVVLWGVCWMFYNHQHDNSVSPQGTRQPREAAETSWGQGAPQAQQPQQWAQADMTNYGFRAQSADSRVRRTPSVHQSNPQVSQAQIDALGSAGLGLHVTTHHNPGAYPTSMAAAMSQSAENLSMSAYRGVVDSAASASSYATDLQATLAANTPTLPSQQQQAPQVARSASAHAQLQNTNKGGPYIRTNTINTPSSSSDASFATPSPAWQQHHQDQGSSHTNYVSQVWQPNPDNTNISTPSTNFTYPTSAASATSHAAFEFPSVTSSGQNFYTSGYNNPSHFRNHFGAIQQLGIPMNDSQGYPSPHSEGQGRAGSLAVENMSPPMVNEASPPDYSPTTRRNSGGFANRDAPRNQMGVIYCDHAECASNPPTFSRKCEWTKHMDKHTRPYVCHQPGCEKIRGFTYSGGLLRHEREVHKKYGGPKAPRFCPHRDCKRSTGTGFSRKENLHEHLRRVHRGVGIEDDGGDGKRDDDDESREETASRARTDTMSTGLGGLGDDADAPSRKRKKGSDGEEGLRETVEELRQANKRLKVELAQKDQRLKVLEDIVMRSMTTQGMRPGNMG